MIAAKGYAAPERGAKLTPFAFERRDPGPHDVVLALSYCGICHSDLHYVRDEWKSSRFPIVPGHEIVGRVTAVGAEVSSLRVGDLAAVGCLVDSCRTCSPCADGDEQFCERRATTTYGGTDRDGQLTQGGYSDVLVVDERFAPRLPAGLDPASAAPVLCAGITTYSPLRHWAVGPGSRVGVVGLGGLGHMAVKFAKAFGAEVTLFTTSPGKSADAARLGAAEVVVTTDPAQLRAASRRFDFILDTVSADHDLGPLLAALRRDGTLCLVGLPTAPAPVAAGMLVSGRRRLAGSSIGGLRETREMLDFCARHGIAADVETIGIGDVDAAFERMLRGDVRYRFVIDLATLR